MFDLHYKVVVFMFIFQNSCFGKHIPNCEHPILFPKGWFTFKVFKEKIFELFILNLINLIKHSRNQIIRIIFEWLIPSIKLQVIWWKSLYFFFSYRHYHDTLTFLWTLPFFIFNSRIHHIMEVNGVHAFHVDFKCVISETS